MKGSKFMQNQMGQRFLTRGLLAVVVAGVLMAGMFGWLRTPVANAQDAASAGARTITVVGEGTVSIKPDTAQANIGVEVIKPTVKEASAENKQVIATVLDALKKRFSVEDLSPKIEETEQNTNVNR